MSFQKVVKPRIITILFKKGFRTVSFQKVVKQKNITFLVLRGFRTVSFQKVVKPCIKKGSTL